MYKPETLTANECELILAELSKERHEKVKGWKCYRNTAIVLLMLDAGLRVGEVCKLRIEDLMIAGCPVSAVNLKGGLAEKGCTRIVPVTLRIQTALHDMWTSQWHKYPAQTVFYAFYDRDPWRHITERQIQRVCWQAGKVAIGRTINPHIFRHTFATRLMRLTNIRIVQQLLGHKHIASTQIYTHPGADDLQAAIGALDGYIQEK